MSNCQIQFETLKIGFRGPGVEGNDLGFRISDLGVDQGLGFRVKGAIRFGVRFRVQGSAAVLN